MVIRKPILVFFLTLLHMCGSLSLIGQHQDQAGIQFRADLTEYLVEANTDPARVPTFIRSKDSLVSWSELGTLIDPPPLSADSSLYSCPAGTFYIIVEENEDSLFRQFAFPLKFNDRQLQVDFVQRYLPDFQVSVSYAFSDSAFGKSLQPTAIADKLVLESVAFNEGQGLVLAWFLVIALNGLIILTFLASRYLKRKMGTFWGTLSVVISALTLRIIAVQPFISKYTSSIPFFSSEHFNESFQSSIGDLLLNTMLFAVIAVFLLAGLYNEKTRNINKWRRIGLTIANYTSILFGVQILAFVTKNLLVEANVPLTLDRIFAINWSTSVVVFSILLFVTGLFFLNYLLIHNISKRNIDPSSRLGALACSAVITLPLFFLLELNVSPFGFYLLAFAYIVLKDVFSDAKTISVSWLVIWMILITGGVSMFLYNYYHEALENQKVQAAGEIIQERFESPSNNMGAEFKYAFDHAIYKDGRFVSGSITKYPANYVLDTLPPVDTFARITSSKRSDLVYRVSQDKWIVVGKEKSSFTNSISLFSFVFVNLFIIAMVLLLLNTRMRWLPAKWNFMLTSKPSLRRRFQLVLFSVLILSFISIGWFTLFFIRDTNTQEDYENLRADLTRAEALIMQADGSNNISRGEVFRRELGYIFNVPVMLFDANGHRLRNGNNISGVRRLPFDTYRAFVTSELNREFERTNLAGKGQIAVSALRNEGHLLGFIGVPIDPSNSTSASINDFLGTLLNMYIFMLIIAGSIALAFADSITRPLSTLGKKFREFKLGAKTEPIDWKSKDELGELIEDYNRMMAELDDSARLLAITEREMAWREMARQVAHEIKNPLTPMKLSIQHLQYAIQRDGQQPKELVERVSNTLVEQIDNLSNIASEFSNFAQMPKPENEKIVLNEVVASVHDLFRKREDMDIQLYVPIDDIFVFADRNHLIRILNNLVKNAIQAIPPERRGVIEIKAYKESEKAVIRVRDNGSGIPENIRDKVFKPNFTSKNSGTGLGLAICANMVDTFNGKIYFHSKTGAGTDFFIEIPLMHMKDNFEEQKRVTL